MQSSRDELNSCNPQSVSKILQQLEWEATKDEKVCYFLSEKLEKHRQMWFTCVLVCWKKEI